jgi:hypothetical protein
VTRCHTPTAACSSTATGTGILPTRGADGAVTGMVVHVVETTRRVRQRQAVEARADDSERRYRQARDVVLALQRSLPPSGVPVLPRLRMAALLSSAGVRLLHRLDARADPAGLRVVAPPGGVVRRVLTLTGLGHLTE